MSTIQAFIKHHPVLTYYVLTFALSWGGIFIVLGPDGIPLSREQFLTLGPFVYLAALAGPSVASLLLTGLVAGPAGLRELLARLLRWRVGVRWYAVALLATPLLATAVGLVLSLRSAEFLPAILTTDDKATLLLTGLSAGLLVGFCEELGWTGFAIPQLRRRYRLLATGLIVGFLWGVWHFPYSGKVAASRDRLRSSSCSCAFSRGCRPTGCSWFGFTTVRRACSWRC